ncbi:MAG: AIPR family protein [Cyanomargarita calcarea GSE-NOS-MK-12-04C]|jgi:hypothetical protein|uniref:AIPR family protein n=1 Tax=Cyanomargarita calcarea GSE-NOS-MK-12-04C TaxID=2839659 RepID=A0A951UVT2_9CYAN|nr:AIPR family protein [Cyanomargarita calcarea GSE-NOS-MK-12-04C]
MSQSIDFEAFRNEWLEEIIQGNPSTVELGNRFSRKLIAHWLDVDESSDDIVYCDGAGDGGIDVAYLNRSQSIVDEGTEEGDTWYLVQSKYGKAFTGLATLLIEAQKIIDTLDGKRNNLSSLAQDLLERLLNFREQASERDKLVIVFATQEPLNEQEKRVLDDIRAFGANRLGEIFDVEAISIATIHQRQPIPKKHVIRINIPLNAPDAKGDKLLVGAVKLIELYKFMKEYRDQTSDLDQLYEKNVRRFLGTRRKVNKAIKDTLEQEPENFGLFNNGVTIVVNNFDKANRGFDLVEPYVVNGCQTTKTIWNVLKSKLESGGTGSNSKLKEWKEKLDKGVVLVKIVKVGSDGQDLLTLITRYTNSQNAVSEKDFIALTQDFQTWQEQIKDKYNLFLEIQRGGWDSQKGLQKQNPTNHQFKNWANAFDLLKVYGAGWLGKAGIAFGTSQAFLPKGSVFKEMNDQIGVDDLYAAYLLQKKANEKYEFGQKHRQTRRFTRFMFYMVVIELLKAVMIDAGIKQTNTNVTKSFLKLFNSEGIFNSEGNLACNELLETAVQVTDEYMTEGIEESVYKEPECKSGDVKGYIRGEKLGEKDYSPKLFELLAIHKRTMKRSTGGQHSPFSLVLEAIKLE